MVISPTFIAILLSAAKGANLIKFQNYMERSTTITMNKVYFLLFLQLLCSFIYRAFVFFGLSLIIILLSKSC